jgi:hypothetical protein
MLGNRMISIGIDSGVLGNFILTIIAKTHEKNCNNIPGIIIHLCSEGTTFIRF